MRGRLARALTEAGAVVLVAVVVGLVANQFSPRSASLMGAGPRTIPVLSTLALPQARAIQEAGSMLFLDARPSAQYSAGHIPGALSLPAEDVEGGVARFQARLQKAGGFVVYCDRRDGAPARATAQGLSARGFGNLYLFPGGWSDWTAAGLPVEEGGP